jgi:hypothetical protein
VQLQQLSQNEDVFGLIHDIGLERGLDVDYELGDINGMQFAMSRAFDFRAGKERSEQTELPNKDKYDSRIKQLAEMIGISGDSIPKNPNAQAAIVLGGAGKAPLDRARYTKELIDSGLLNTNTVVLLGSSRPVNEAEIERAGEYAKGAKTEYDLMLNAAMLTFDIEFNEAEELVGYDDKVPEGFEKNWRISHQTTEDGIEVFVIQAQMGTDPFYLDGNRRERANTSDTYNLFARVANFEKGSHIVIVTNAHFGPFQGADAAKEFADYGLTADLACFEPAHFGNPEKTPEELLQESLSAVNSRIRAISHK